MYAQEHHNRESGPSQSGISFLRRPQIVSVCCGRKVNEPLAACNQTRSTAKPPAARGDTLRSGLVEMTSSRCLEYSVAYKFVTAACICSPEKRGAAGREGCQERHEQKQFRYSTKHFFFSFILVITSYLQFLPGVWDSSDPQPVGLAPT
jgi:hypothetical protein